MRRYCQLAGGGGISWRLPARLQLVNRWHRLRFMRVDITGHSSGVRRTAHGAGSIDSATYTGRGPRSRWAMRCAPPTFRRNTRVRVVVLFLQASRRRVTVVFWAAYHTRHWLQACETNSIQGLVKWNVSAGLRVYKSARRIMLSSTPPPLFITRLLQRRQRRHSHCLR